MVAANQRSWKSWVSGALTPSSGNVSITPGEKTWCKQAKISLHSKQYSVIDVVIMGDRKLWEVKQERDRIYSLPQKWAKTMAWKSLSLKKRIRGNGWLHSRKPLRHPWSKQVSKKSFTSRPDAASCSGLKLRAYWHRHCSQTQISCSWWTDQQLGHSHD